MVAINIGYLFVSLLNAITGSFDTVLGHALPECLFLGRLLSVLNSIANGFLPHPNKVFLCLFIGHAESSQVLQLWSAVQYDDDKTSAWTDSSVDIFQGHTVQSLSE